MEPKPVLLDDGPAVWKRVLIWYGTVWLAGVIAGFLYPNSDNTSYAIGHILIGTGAPLEVIESFVELFIGSFFSAPMNLFFGLNQIIGNSVGAKGFFILLVFLICVGLCAGHLFFFLTTRMREFWYVLWIILIFVSMASMAGCMMNYSPHLW